AAKEEAQRQQDEIANTLFPLARLTAEKGSRTDAIAMYERVLTVCQKLAAVKPEKFDRFYNLASCHVNLGQLWAASRPDRAEKEYGKAEMILTAARRDFPEEARAAQGALADLLVKRGALYSATNSPEQADKAFKTAISTYRRLLQQELDRGTTNTLRG